MRENYLYIRGLRQVDHTVFCVANGQKTYYDPVTGRQVPYSSGQQVKHSLLDLLSEHLSEARAPVVFNWKLSEKSGKQLLEEGEVWSACNPAYADQLIGGWMKASKDSGEGVPVKRRSPLSISAMRPLHPSLSGLSKEQGTFDRSNDPQTHSLRVTDETGAVVPLEKLIEFQEANSRNIPLRKFLPDDQVGQRASGLFVYDIAIDLRTLFSVSTSTFDPELALDMIASLLTKGWTENKKTGRLICPKAQREAIIPALAHSLINWRVTSNQSRTYSPQNTLAVAISRNANRLGAAIRADLSEESNYKRAQPILEKLDGVDLYTALTARAYIGEVIASVDALTDAEKKLVSLLQEYDYEA